MLNYKDKYLKYKKKYLDQKNKNVISNNIAGGASKLKKETSTQINVVFTNPSWAIQQGLEIGSEKDMAQRCKKKYLKQSSDKSEAVKTCFNNTKKILDNLKQPFDVLGMVEVGNMGSYDKTEEHLKKLINYNNDYKINLGEIETSTRASSSKLKIYISIIYNKKIFGKTIKTMTFNLSENDGRPCIFVLTSKCLFINLHGQGMNNLKSKRNFEKTLTNKFNLFVNQIMTKNNNENKKILKSHLKRNNIIIMGDFNDNKTLISKEKPFKINLNNPKLDLSFHNNMTKNKLMKHLATCCWHREGHKYRNPKTGPQVLDTGDYILTSGNIPNKSFIIKEEHIKDCDLLNSVKNNKIKKELLDFSSDHKFIGSIIELQL